MGGAACTVKLLGVFWVLTVVVVEVLAETVVVLLGTAIVITGDDEFGVIVVIVIGLAIEVALP